MSSRNGCRLAGAALLLACACSDAAGTSVSSVQADARPVLGADDPKFFDASTAAQAVFRSTKIDLTGPRTAEVTGDLTFLSVTRPLVLDVVLNGGMKNHPMAKTPALGFSARGTMKRSGWSMQYGQGEDLADDVELLIEAEFLREEDAR